MNPPPPQRIEQVTVERVKRQVIEHKLLTALEEGGTVAILLREKDLRLIIACLRMAKFSTEAKEMCSDFERLLKEGFPT